MLFGHVCVWEPKLQIKNTNRYLKDGHIMLDSKNIDSYVSRIGIVSMFGGIGMYFLII